MSAFFSGRTASERPLGGSESALFYLSREMAKIGHKVEIFNNCFNEAGLYEGVQYRNFTTLLELVRHSKKTDYDIFISFRDLPAFLFPIRAKKRIWWGHDDFSNVWDYKAFLRISGFLANRIVDHFFVVSSWLAEICKDKLGIKREKIYITRNGVYLPYFTQTFESPRDCRLVYTSIPERGLDILLKIFSIIKKEIPDASLHVYSGKALGWRNKKEHDELDSFYNGINQDGIFLRSPLNHKDLAKELEMSSLFLYPSHPVKNLGFYAETSCIAALEAQAAGCPVIASNSGALNESILNGKTGILINGNPDSEEFQNKFARETISLLKDKKRIAQFRNNCIELIKNNYSWDLIAKEWTFKFKEMLR